MSFFEGLKNSLSGLAFETPRLRIRGFKDGDEEGLLTLFGDETTMFMDGDVPITEKNAEFARRVELIKSGPLIWFFLENRENGDFVGFIMLQPAPEGEGRAVTVGYSLTPAYQRQGRAKEALLSLFEALKAAGTERVLANIREKNLPSRKLVGKLGFFEYGRTEGAHRNPKNGERSANVHFRLDLIHTEQKESL